MSNNVVDFTINLNGNAVSGSVELKDTIQQLRESVDRAVKSFAQFGELASGLDVVTGTVEKVTQSFGKMVDLSMNFERQYGNLKSDMDQSAKATRDAASAMDDYAEKCDDASTETKDLSEDVRKVADETSRIPSVFGGMSESIGQHIVHLDSLINVIGHVSQAFSTLVGTSLEFEQQQANLKTLLNGDAQATENLVGKIREYASATVYDRSGLVEAQKTMMAFGLDAEYAFGKLKNIGDIALGDKQKMQSLALAFSQMSSTGKLMGQDLLQMINAGFNPLEVISQKTGKSIAELKEEMGKGAISAEQVAQAFEWATEEGGRFYKGADTAAETTAGKIAKIQDNIDNFKVSLFEATGGLTAYVAEVTKMLVPIGQISPLIAGISSMVKKVKALDFAGMMTKWRHSVNGARISLAFMRKDIATCNMASLGFIGNTVRATMAVGRFATMGLFNALKGIGAYILSLVTGGAASKTFANVATASFAQFALSAKAACKAVGFAIKSIPIIGWIAAAISAVVGLGALLWNRSEKFRKVLFGVWEAVKAVANNVFVVLKTVVQVVWSMIHPLFVRIGELFSQVRERVRPILPKIRTFASKALQVIVTVVKVVTAVVGGIVGVAVLVIKGVISVLLKFREKVVAVITPIRDFFGNLGQSVVGIVRQDIEGIVGFFQKMYDRIAGVFSKIGNFVAQVWSWVSNTAGSIWNNMIAKLGGVATWIKTKMVDPIRNAFTRLWNIVSGVFDKILNKLGRLFAPIRELWNKVFPKDKMRDVSSAYSAGAKKGSESWKRDKASKEEKTALSGDVDTSKVTEVIGKVSVSGEEPTTKSGKTAKGLKDGEMGKTAGVTAGKAQQITIKLENMVGTMNFNGSLQEKASDVEARLTEMMARILGMAETAV